MNGVERVAPRARWRERVVAYGRVLPEPTASAAPCGTGLDDAGVRPIPRAWTWAALMQRAFGIDVLACPQCGGPAALDRHPARSRRDPANPQAPRPLPFGAESWPSSARARRRRVLIGSGRGAAGAVVSFSRTGIRAESAGPWAD